MSDYQRYLWKRSPQLPRYVKTNNFSKFIMLLINKYFNFLPFLLIYLLLKFLHYIKLIIQ